MVTEKFLVPVVAVLLIVMFAVMLSEALTVVLLTVMSLPPTFTELTPLIKFVPLKPTFNVCKRFPLDGEILVSVGEGLFTINV